MLFLAALYVPFSNHVFPTSCCSTFGVFEYGDFLCIFPLAALVLTVFLPPCPVATSDPETSLSSPWWDDVCWSSYLRHWPFQCNECLVAQLRRWYGELVDKGHFGAHQVTESKWLSVALSSFFSAAILELFTASSS